MPASKVQNAWRDFAIGLLIVVASSRLFPAVLLRSPHVSIALLAAAGLSALLGSLWLCRYPQFRSVGRSLRSVGNIGAREFLVLGICFLLVMCATWTGAQYLGGRIDMPMGPWSPGLSSRFLPAGYFAASSFYALIIAPLLEELSFRGWMQGGLAQGFPKLIAVLTPTLLFAALHGATYSHPAYLLIPLVLGSSLGFVAYRAQSIWPSTALHVLWNLCMVLVALGVLNTDAFRSGLSAAIAILAGGAGMLGMIGILGGSRGIKPPAPAHGPETA